MAWHGLKRSRIHWRFRLIIFNIISWKSCMVLWSKISTHNLSREGSKLNLIREGFFLPLLCFTMLSYSLQQVCRRCAKIWCTMRSMLLYSHWWLIRIIVIQCNRCENEVMHTIGCSHAVKQNLVNESEATTRFCCRYCFWSGTVIRLFPFVTNLENGLWQLRLWRILCLGNWWHKRV